MIGETGICNLCLVGGALDANCIWISVDIPSNVDGKTLARRYYRLHEVELL